MKKINFILALILFASCEKNELPIQKHTMGDVESYQTTQTIYEHQIFYNLESNNAIKNNPITEWDIAFENSREGWKIILNSSRYSDISEFEDYNFEKEITQNEINNVEKSWDDPKGLNYQTAIGDYRNKNSIYVINRGYNIDGSAAGYKKIIIDSVNDQYYQIRYSNLNNSNTKSIQITKQNSTHFQYLSFDSDSIVSIEPAKQDWDLLFTQYTTLWNDPEYPTYLVRGVFSNYLNNVLVAKDTTKFENINYDMINSYSFSNNQNDIGFAWKTYDMESNSYITSSDTTYIIKSISDRYFKLRFIDFYNSDIERGYPEFEIQEL
tara:strand:+ start:24 stop:992 length:969 start_codon:yes stop_codon:yes gene_type:complete